MFSWLLAAEIFLRNEDRKGVKIVQKELEGTDER
jgi:hypothetical protein